MERDENTCGHVWWIAALYFASNSALALGPEITSSVGSQLAAVFAAGALLCGLGGWTAECRGTADFAI